MPTARFGMDSVVWNDEIYVIGGRDGNLVLSTVEKYNSATDTWTPLRSMPTGRWNPMTEVVDGKIYAIGGISEPVTTGKHLQQSRSTPSRIIPGVHSPTRRSTGKRSLGGSWRCNLHYQRTGGHGRRSEYRRQCEQV